MYRIIFCVICLVPGSFCSSLKRIRRHEPTEASLLLPPYHNACADPVPSSFAATEEGVIDNVPEFLEHLKESSQTFRDQLIQETTRMERRINCQTIVAGMRSLDVDDFVAIESSLGTYQNNITQMYSEMRTLLYLFEILQSPKLEQCCMHITRFYFRLQNRLLRKWFTLQEHSGQRIQDRHCCLRGSDVINRHLTCEIIRDLVYTVLSEGISTIERSIDFLEERLHL